MPKHSYHDNSTNCKAWIYSNTHSDIKFKYKTLNVLRHYRLFQRCWRSIESSGVSSRVGDKHYRRFEGKCCRHLFDQCRTVWPWIWRYYVPSKRLSLFTSRQVIIFPNTWLFSKKNIFCCFSKPTLYFNIIWFHVSLSVFNVFPVVITELSREKRVKKIRICN